MKFLFYFQIFSLHLISIGSIGAQRFCTLIALRVCGIDAHIYAFIILSKKREKNKTISSLCLNGKNKPEKNTQVSTLYRNKTQNTKKENNNTKSIISIGRTSWDVLITLYPFKFPHIVVVYTCVSLGLPKKNGCQLYYVLLYRFGEVSWKELGHQQTDTFSVWWANKKNKQLRKIFF